MNSKLLLDGSFDENEIFVSVLDSSNRQIIPEIESQIQTLWQQTLADAQAKGQLAYDGDLYRLEDAKVVDGKLYIDLSRIKFSVVSGLKKLLDKISLKDEEYSARCVAIGGLIRTSDNKFVFGRKTSNTLTNNTEDFIGGLLENPEVANGSDLFAMNRREMVEEASIDANEIEHTRLIQILSTSTSKVILLTFNQLNIDSEELLRKFGELNDHFELSDLVIVEESNLKEYLKSLKGYREIVAENISPEKLR